jgi:hypothetical protein
MSKTVHLHCPSINRTVANFVISPFQSNDQILQGVRLALQIPHATLYTAEAKLIKLDSIQEDQRILVAATPLEHMLPDSPIEFEFYDGQESENVDPDLDGYGQIWESLSEREKCDHIMSLNHLEPTTRNKLRIVRQWQPVLEDLTILEDATSEQLGTQFPAMECEALIEQRWHSTIDHLFPDTLKPTKLKPAGKYWDPKVVAALSVLSSLTPGQARLAVEFLEEAVQLRVSDGQDKSPGVQVRDVVNAITIIYERAGVIAAKLTKPKSAKARERERKKALREKMKAGAKGKGKALGEGEE